MFYVFVIASWGGGGGVWLCAFERKRLIFWFFFSVVDSLLSLHSTLNEHLRLLFVPILAGSVHWFFSVCVLFPSFPAPFNYSIARDSSDAYVSSCLRFRFAFEASEINSFGVFPFDVFGISLSSVASSWSSLISLSVMLSSLSPLPVALVSFLKLVISSMSGLNFLLLLPAASVRLSPDSFLALVLNSSRLYRYSSETASRSGSSGLGLASNNLEKK